MATRSDRSHIDSGGEPFAAEDWVHAALEWVQRSDSTIPNPARDVFPSLPTDRRDVAAIGIDLIESLQRPAVSLPGLSRPGEKEQKEIRLRLAAVCRAYASALQQACLDAISEADDAISELIAKVAGELFRSLYELDIVEGQGLLLQTLAWPRTEDSLSILVQRLVSHPPADWTVTALALSPLMRHADWPVDTIFPPLLAGLHRPTMIAPILDLANFCYRQGRVAQHPAADFAASLTQLLGGVVGRLGMLEEDPTRFGESPEAIQRVLNDAIAVCVALCDALGLMEFEPAIGKLHQALALRHRRVQTEAAGALARMKQTIGCETLIGLAAEPISRLRALHYAEELSLSDQIDDKYRQPEALAESELALWLSQPQQLGLPPRRMELLDQRMLFWPGYDEPQACFLFRYQYSIPQGEWSNIGMAGPLVHSFAADLADLPISDIYALFAGWHAEHPEIFEIPIEHWNASHQRLATPLQKHLEDHGHDAMKLFWLGCFLGETCLVAETCVEGAQGVAVTDGLETIWYPRVGRSRPLGPLEAYSIYKGRKMLRTFNPDLSSDLSDET